MIGGFGRQPGSFQGGRSASRLAGGGGDHDRGVSVALEDALEVGHVAVGCLPPLAIVDAIIELRVSQATGGVRRASPSYSCQRRGESILASRLDSRAAP